MIWFRFQAAILLLGNVEFAPGGGEESYDVEVIGKDELNSVANLLGISTPSLWQGLTTRTHLVRGQLVKSMSDANLVSLTSNVQTLAYTRIFHGGGIFVWFSRGKQRLAESGICVISVCKYRISKFPNLNKTVQNFYSL